MKANNFLILYNVRTKDNHNLTDEIILQTVTDLAKPKQYIAYDDKIKLVEKTIEGTFNEKYPSVIQSRKFIINLINEYTSIELDNDGYDLLCQSHLIDYVLLTFESDFKICQSLLKMCLQDLYQKGGT